VQQILLVGVGDDLGIQKKFRNSTVGVQLQLKRRLFSSPWAFVVRNQSPREAHNGSDIDAFRSRQPIYLKVCRRYSAPVHKHIGSESAAESEPARHHYNIAKGLLEG
jgi:hypothetical protein